MSSQKKISFDQFKQQWLAGIDEPNLSSVEKGRRFAQKIVSQWLDLDTDFLDLTYCDGAGDGGIDLAYLHHEEPAATDATGGDVWFLVQSKYGAAFQGEDTLVREGRKVIDTLAGKKKHLSSLAEGVVEKLKHFLQQAGDHGSDRLVLVFATVDPVTDDETTALDDVRTLGRSRLGPMFDVQAISLHSLYEKMPASEEPEHVRVPIRTSVTPSGDRLLVGATGLADIYQFLKAYRATTHDLDRLYDKNVRRFLGMRRAVNQAMKRTLEEEPEKFGLFNNGITIVVADFTKAKDGTYQLEEPYVVNGCQTTRTIWHVLDGRLGAGGTGTDAKLRDWEKKIENGVVVTKIVKVGTEGAQLLQDITRHTNTQNAIREKDFIALEDSFRIWAQAFEKEHGIYLEIQRGGWDSRRAIQKQNPKLKQITVCANAFDLLKVYAAGWLGEAGKAFGKNEPYAPGGDSFERIVGADDATNGGAFGVDDLYAAHLLQTQATALDFGRGAKSLSRRQTKFLFYHVFIELLKYTLTSAGDMSATPKQLTKALLVLADPKHKVLLDELLSAASGAIDDYMNKASDDSIFEEAEFVKRNSDLNSFLKWEKLGDGESCPVFKRAMSISKKMLARATGGHPSVCKQVTDALRAGPK